MGSGEGKTRKPPDEYAVPIDEYKDLVKLVTRANEVDVKLTKKKKVVALMIGRDRFAEIAKQLANYEDLVEAMKRTSDPTQHSEEQLTPLKLPKSLMAK